MSNGLSSFLKERRAQLGQTQEQAAAIVGVHTQTWSDWERGTRPGTEAIFRIADWAGCTVDSLRTYLDPAA